MESGQTAIIYARCSTNESRQDVEVQLAELRRYAQAFGWQYDEVWEYDSGFKGEQPKLQRVLKRIKRKECDTLLVYSLDRFRRQAPSKVNRLLDELVEQDGVRFISRLEGIDSANELTWNVVRPIFAYFANLFSRTIRLANPQVGWRILTKLYNDGLPELAPLRNHLVSKVSSRQRFWKNGRASVGCGILLLRKRLTPRGGMAYPVDQLPLSCLRLGGPGRGQPRPTCF